MKPERKLRLLVCDPDPKDRAMIRNYLEDAPIRISFISQGDAVQDVLANRSPFDAVVIDLSHAPNPACDAVVSAIKRTSPGTEIIFMSRLADEALWSRVLSMGAYDLLPKPPERAEFLRAVLGAVQVPHAA